MRPIVRPLFVALFLLAGCASAPSAFKPLASALSTSQASSLSTPIVTTAVVLDNKPRLAVMSAFDAELALLLSKTENKQEYIVNGQSFTTGRLAGHDVVLLLSGGSTVNAAMSTQRVLDGFNVTHILFSGIAGGVDPSLNVGDVVLPDTWIEYQEFLAARENPDGSFAPPSWFKPTLPNFGMFYPQKVGVMHSGLKPNATEQVAGFKADPAMLETARKIAGTVKLNRCTPDNVCLSNTPTFTVGGNGVSGSTFADNAKYREWVWETWKPVRSLDMESSALAHVAYHAGVPFAIFRSLSDLAGGGKGENEIPTGLKIAAPNSALVLLAWLQAWPV